MKLLVLQASGRLNGNTARCVSILEEALAEEASSSGTDLELETVHLATRDLRPCQGCRSCFDRGEHTCPQRDDLLLMKEKMRAADGLILAGPVYVNDVNGIVKTWIDRLAHVCHRPEFAGKTAMVLATTGSTPARHTLRSMQVALWTWGYRVAVSEWFRTGAASTLEEIRRRHGPGISRAAGNLFRDILSRRFMKPSLLSLVVFRIQQLGWSRAAADSIDHAYWQQKGWLELRGTSFFFPHSAARLKTFFARLLGTMAAALYL